MKRPHLDTLARLAFERERVLVYVPARGPQRAHLEIAVPPPALDTPIRLEPNERAEARMSAEERS